MKHGMIDSVDVMIDRHSNGGNNASPDIRVCSKIM